MELEDKDFKIATLSSLSIYFEKMNAERGKLLKNKTSKIEKYNI